MCHILCREFVNISSVISFPPTSTRLPDTAAIKAYQKPQKARERERERGRACVLVLNTRYIAPDKVL